VPVVTRECGLSVNGLGPYIEPCNIPEISRLVQELSGWQPSRLEQASRAARLAAQNDYSQVKFLHSLEQAIQAFL
jgi:hypothetical protein